jgi:hypothetical protein
VCPASRRWLLPDMCHGGDREAPGLGALRLGHQHRMPCRDQDRGAINSYQSCHLGLYVYDGE